MSDDLKVRLARLADSAAPPEPEVEAFVLGARRPPHQKTRTIVLVLVVLIVAVGLPLWALTGLGSDEPRTATATEERIVVQPMPQLHVPSRIYSVRPDGSDVTPILSDANADDRWPALSPDGTQLAFIRSQRGPDGRHCAIYLANAEGTDQRELVSFEDPLTMGVSDLLWSPDGSTIGFVEMSIPRKDAGKTSILAEDIRSRLWLVAPDGSDLHMLVDREIRGFSWSPDGSQIAYTGPGGGDYLSTDIYVMASDGSDPHRLTTDHVSRVPLWSPDGTAIAFAAGGPSRTMLMSPDGSSLRAIPHTGLRSIPLAWSGDGERLLVRQSLDHVCSLFVTDGTQTTLISRGQVTERDPPTLSDARFTPNAVIACAESASWHTPSTSTSASQAGMS